MQRRLALTALLVSAAAACPTTYADAGVVEDAAVIVDAAVPVADAGTPDAGSDCPVPDRHLPALQVIARDNFVVICLCDVTATQDGGAIGDITNIGVDEDCKWYGAVDRGGDFRVYVDCDGYVPQDRAVTVPLDECGDPPPNSFQYFDVIRLDAGA